MIALSIDDVVALNALIVTAIGLTFVLNRKGHGSNALGLTGADRANEIDQIAARRNQGRQPESKVGGHSSSTYGSGHSSSTYGSGHSSSTYGATALKRLEESQAQPVDVVAGELRQLSVFFNWNGHTWDAHEVLGIAPGASRETVIQAFHQSRSQSPDSTPFLQAAADSILKR